MSVCQLMSFSIDLNVIHLRHRVLHTLPHRRQGLWVPTFAATTRGRWRVTRHDAALCSPKACAFFDSTGATVSIKRAAARSTVSPAVSTTAEARA
jgi:hypothetical protein